MERNESEAIDLILHHRCGEDPCVWTRAPKSPAELLMEREDAEMELEVQRRLRLARVEVLRKFIEEIFAQGRNPGRVVRNLYTYVLVLFPEVLAGLKPWEVSEVLLSETRAALSARVKMIQRKLDSGRGRKVSTWRAQCERSARVEEAARNGARLRKPWAKKKRSATMKAEDSGKAGKAGRAEGVKAGRKKKKDGQLNLPF